MSKVEQVASKPSHYCVICAARWLKHDDGTWSVQTDCGPCCDNVPMDKAPLIEFQADGSLRGDDADCVKRAYNRVQRQKQIEHYKGIVCALCDQPFEDHGFGDPHDWTCRKRIAPRFTFPKDDAANTARALGRAGGYAQCQGEVVERIQDRVEYASKMYHDSTRWESEDAPDGEGSLFDWIFATAIEQSAQGDGG